MRRPASMGVKLGTYDDSTCLETFPCWGRNFAAYFNWASPRGPVDQLLWDFGPDLTLSELIHLLRQHFCTVNQTDWFQTELKWKPGKEQQQLYNEVCRLMSLAYPGPSSDLSHLVGCDAFLEVRDDPGVHPGPALFFR